MMKTVIMIIDDDIEKCRPIEKVAEILGIETVTFYALIPAIEYLLTTNKVNGIVTDMKYPIFDSIPKVEEAQAGNFLLEWLTQQKRKIPVLGNSFCNFNNQYPYYQGKMPGFFCLDIFLEFISSIKDHN